LKSRSESEPEYTGVREFKPGYKEDAGGEKEGENIYKISKKFDVYSMANARVGKEFFRIFGAKYKKVAEKVKPVDIGTGGDKPDGIPD
jgi:hypothetical protein